MELMTNDSQSTEPLLSSSDLNKALYDELNKIPVSRDIRPSSFGAYASDANPLIQRASSKHIRSLFATLILFSGVGTLLGLAFAGKIDLSVGGLIASRTGIYVLYLMVVLR